MHDTMPISVSDYTLRIDDFETRERDIVAYFNGLHDPDDEEKLVTLLKLGILAQSSVGTTMDVKYVEKAFELLKDKFDKRMDDIFEPNGTMDNKLAEHFGQDGKIIKEIFNPDTEGTPLNRLKATLHDDLAGIRDTIVIQKGREIEARKGTHKGTKFEDFCQPFLEDIARVFSDIVDPTGTTKEKGSDSQKGDFVVTLAGGKKKIVFEMKHRESRLSYNDIRSQLNEAMKTRGADYGVLVSRNRSILKKSIGWFNEYDSNKLVCALAETEDDEENTWVIDVAYKWARQRVESAGDKHLGMDPELIKQDVNRIKESIEEIKKIDNHCTHIRNATDKIEEVVKKEERIIQNKIKDILSSMDSTSQS